MRNEGDRRKERGRWLEVRLAPQILAADSTPAKETQAGFFVLIVVVVDQLINCLMKESKKMWKYLSELV